MKLFSRDEMQRLEGAGAQAGISLGEMMENAGKALAQEGEKRCPDLPGKRVVLLCGCGNNGGDGFVCARELFRRGADCTVLLVQGMPRSDLARSAFSSLPEDVRVIDGQTQRSEGEAAVAGAQILVDAVFGFSFRGEMPEAAAYFLNLAGERDCLKLSADLPSGAHCDTGRVSAGAFRADVTVTFTGKKPAHASYPAKEYCGETVVRQVGIPEAFREEAGTRCFETEQADLLSWLKEPGIQCNKGDMGRLFLVCGSYGMAGACVMAGKGALRCGVGLLHIAAERSIYPILAQAVPEAIFTVLDLESRRGESVAALLQGLDRADACLMGCGLGSLAEILCPPVLNHSKCLLVLDADGLNYAAAHPGVLEDTACPLILTPHPGEMARLCQDAVPEIQADRLGAAREKARETGAVVVLKGAATVVAGPDGRCALNPTGNPGMAKGGSGDVLAGIIASLAAQGLACFEAAAAGAYLHGMAGDLCRASLSRRAMLPTDLPDMLPQVFSSLAALQREENLIQ